MNIKTELGQVLEAAQIRHDQWEGIANGETVDAVTEELAEVAGDPVAGPGEARRLANLLSDAIQLIHAADLVTGETATTALCIWEEALHSDSHDEMSLQSWLNEEEGVYQGRNNCVKIAPFFDAVYERIAARGYGGAFAFDWEIVPWVLGYVVENYASPTELAERHPREAQIVANAFLESEDNSHV